ncbi:MAG: ribonuclease E inhibitor RraB [Paraglaciecola sp.]|uniref:ribonuclease E inhibitor RraB n=2 Tax=Paraglaciecola sp. TaxID=1920173 RepID=UPI00326401EC
MIRIIFSSLMVLFVTACAQTRDFPNDANGQVLQQFKDSGVDLDKECVVDFCHLFVDEESAKNMANEVVEIFLDVEVDIYVDLDPISVCVSRKMVPTHKSITMAEYAFAGIANKYGGVSDGWGFMVDSL